MDFTLVKILSALLDSQGIASILEEISNYCSLALDLSLDKETKEKWIKCSEIIKQAADEVRKI